MKHILTYTTMLLVLGCEVSTASGVEPDASMTYLSALDTEFRAVPLEVTRCVVSADAYARLEWTCGIEAGLSILHIGRGATIHEATAEAYERWARYRLGAWPDAGAE